ncbi:MAG: MopE-related protein [Flavobacteriales bacterium]
MKRWICLGLIGCALHVGAQSVERSVVSSWGILSSNATLNASATVGEVIVFTGESASIVLNQGFQQNGGLPCDNNGNGILDPDEVTTYYLDSDDDGFGNPEISVEDCVQPDGFVLNDTDCDDSDNSTFPEAPEQCNGFDDDCDEIIDEEVVTQAFYSDLDGDGFGEALIGEFCEEPEGAVTNNLDCDDSNALISPNEIEICDDIDNNCDTQIDEGLLVAFYPDVDGDGYGDDASPSWQCAQPSGFVANNEDCDDFNSTIYPGATEYCNGIDDDCDEVIDEDCINSVTELSQHQVLLFPNPVSNEFYIELQGFIGLVDCVIYDLSGKEVYKEKLQSTGQSLIDCSALAAGTYVVSLTQQDVQINNRLVKL